MGTKINRALCLTDRLVFSAKPGINLRDFLQVIDIIALGLVGPHRVELLARGCERRQRLLLITTRTRKLSLSHGTVISRPLPSSNHSTCCIVITQVKRCEQSAQPDHVLRTKVERHLIKKRLSRDRIAPPQLDRRQPPLAPRVAARSI